MTQTARLSLPQIVPGMTSKEVVHNEALAILSMLVQPVIVGPPAQAPVADAQVGDMMIVAAGASAEFAGQDGAVALLEGAGWKFVAPFAGLTVVEANSGQTWRFDGSDWIEGEISANSVRVGGVQVLGGQQSGIGDPSGGTTVDSEARQALGAILVALRAHGLIAGAQ